MSTIKRYWLSAVALTVSLPGLLAAKLSGVHVCQDEVYALFLMLPFLAPAVRWVRTWAAIWRDRHRKPQCRHRCDHHARPEFCTSCLMPHPDHDDSCRLHGESWEGGHHYAAWSTMCGAYVACTRNGLTVYNISRAGRRMTWIPHVESCPVCGPQAL